MLKHLKKLFKDEDGAVSVDWVVLTAALIGAGIAILSSTTDGTKGLSDKMSTQMVDWKNKTY